MKLKYALIPFVFIHSGAALALAPPSAENISSGAPAPQAAPASQPAPDGAPPVAAAMNDAVLFEQLLKNKLPLSPDQIRQTRQSYDEFQEAAAKPPKPIKIQSVMFTIDPKPGIKPVRAFIAPGFVTSIQFIDSSGTAWPIEKDGIQIANDKIQAVAGTSDSSDHIVTLSSKGINPYMIGSMSVLLKGLETPIPISLEGNNQDVNAVATLRVSGSSPKSSSTAFFDAGVPGADTGALGRMISGMPPADNARPVDIPIQGVTAWRYGASLWISATKSVSILDPAWRQRSVAPGVTAYEIPLSSRVLFSVAGTVHSVKVSEMPNVYGAK